MAALGIQGINFSKPSLDFRCISQLAINSTYFCQTFTTRYMHGNDITTCSRSLLQLQVLNRSRSYSST